jgi:NAD(P)-dependent dehydrogenase (short-subunit alcohol dehydrogenase family)
MAVQIAGTAALVTGANRGIGRALVEALLGWPGTVGMGFGSTVAESAS